ncbi:type II toxin-antitoxin system PemK/MazF family toxin [Candidatus Woesearchaeota archaeon]|nr:type II toxin-antitoxin system PemK/MazF family toxin [Candidatus Woesearchaeota archaeon]
MFDQGEVLIVPYPFTDLTAIKQRPVLILSRAEYNQKGQDLITCGITSNLRNEDCSVLIHNGNLAEGQIPVKSRIKADKLFTISQSLVRKRVARVAPYVLSQVKAELLKII